HPLYRLLDGNVAALRQANILITFGLATLTAGAVLSSVVPSRPLGLVPRTVIALGLASGALALFSTWLPTPSYNSLNLQSLLVAATGLAWSCSDRVSTQLRGQLLVGAGGWLAFMAKPSTALALGVFVLLFWLLTRRLSLRGLLISVATATLLLMGSALWIDGSIDAFASRLTTGLEVAGQLGGGHTITNVLRMDAFKLKVQEQTLFFTLAALVFAWIQLLSSQRFAGRALGAVTAGAAVLFVILWTAGVVEDDLKLGKFQNLLYAAISLAALLTALARWLRRLGGPAPVPARALLPLLAMPVLAYAYAFGTNGNYWSTSAFAAFFWLMPSLVLASSTDERHDPVFSLVPLVLATQVITVVVLQTGMERPYRQMQPLRLNNHAVDFGQPGSTLMLSGPYADYLNAATGTAQAAGLAPGTPMIDLSGQSPGILYALQAESLGLAWMIGGYPGSARLATFALASVPCEKLAQAWVLSEPGGPRSLSEEVLGAFGADITAHYQQVGAWMTAAGAGRNLNPRRQMLWKPVRNPMHAQQACESARNKGSL
ncbi:MAG TPA: hypothetical protein VFY22_04425, partial [Hydrogenophaga sp.]|nr:hypothetical protein [Hydrogenophaga sp.]